MIYVLNSNDQAFKIGYTNSKDALIRRFKTAKGNNHNRKNQNLRRVPIGFKLSSEVVDEPVEIFCVYPNADQRLEENAIRIAAMWTGRCWGMNGEWFDGPPYLGVLAVEMCFLFENHPVAIQYINGYVHPDDRDRRLEELGLL